MTGDDRLTGDDRGHHALDARRYRLDELWTLVEERPRLSLAPEVADAIRRGAEYVGRLATEDRHLYGVNTGFGSLCETRIAPGETEQLQLKHVLSHACGVGDPTPEPLARLVMLVKLLTFRGGHTGISLLPVERLIELWNRDAVPVIPERGTVGASGDLAPLAHLALPLLGRGEVYFRGRVVDGGEALAELGLEPLRLKAKEGLALTNGVQYISALAAEAVVRFDELARTADLVAALSIQAFSGARAFFHPAYHGTTLHPERKTVAANLARLLEGGNHADLPTANRSQQDPYSFRCIPQVHGAVRQALGFARQVLEQEVNGVSDNPLFFPDQELALFGGNLHGESTALAADFLTMAVAELASISERRTYQLLSGQRGLPSFLVENPGLDSGFMIIQYTSAALVNENKVLSTPASVDTIPTCQLQEDHVSMGGTSVHKLRRVLDNCELVLGIELLVAAQAAELNSGLALSAATRPLLEELRARVPRLTSDRVLAGDIETARELLAASRRRWIAELEIA